MVLQSDVCVSRSSQTQEIFMQSKENKQKKNKTNKHNGIRALLNDYNSALITMI